MKYLKKTISNCWNRVIHYQNLNFFVNSFVFSKIFFKSIIYADCHRQRRNSYDFKKAYIIHILCPRSSGQFSHAGCKLPNQRMAAIFIPVKTLNSDVSVKIKNKTFLWIKFPSNTTVKTYCNFIFSINQSLAG